MYACTIVTSLLKRNKLLVVASLFTWKAKRKQEYYSFGICLVNDTVVGHVRMEFVLQLLARSTFTHIVRCAMCGRNCTERCFTHLFIAWFESRNGHKFSQTFFLYKSKVVSNCDFLEQKLIGIRNVTAPWFYYVLCTGNLISYLVLIHHQSSSSSHWNSLYHDSVVA